MLYFPSIYHFLRGGRKVKKNFCKKLLSLLLVLICALSLAACGGKNSIAGTYKLQSLEMEGMSMDLEEMSDILGIDSDDLNASLSLKEDGSFSLDMSALDESMSVEGTWKSTGSGVDLTAEGDTITATVKGDTITLEDSGTSMVFKKN